MNESVESLQEFIKEFSLKCLDGTAAFYATIHILLNGRLQLLNSNVQIITSNDLATIYILDLDTADGQLPDMFEAKKNLFTNVKGLGLKLSGKTSNGNFIISVYPKEK